MKPTESCRAEDEAGVSRDIGSMKRGLRGKGECEAVGDSCLNNASDKRRTVMKSLE
jgi:hypothetical protein